MVLPGVYQARQQEWIVVFSRSFNVMTTMYFMPVVVNPVALPLRDRTLVVALVVLAHVALLWLWAASPGLTRPVHREMSVSIAMLNPPQAVPETPAPQPAARHKPVEVQRMPTVETPVAAVDMPATPSVASVAPEQTVIATPELPGHEPDREPDREPDYQAAYLHNPIPSYPMVARRMGWQGRVVLNVEVLASGLPGQVKVQQSSGHEVLDNAALNTVGSWRFVPARHNGEPVTRRFLVPIPFILQEE